MVGAVTGTDRGWGVNSETAIELAYLYMKAWTARRAFAWRFRSALSFYGGVLRRACN